MPVHGHQLPSLWELVLFALVAVVGLVFGAVMFYRVLGLVGVAWALSHLVFRKIPVGVEGRLPLFHIRGSAAIVVGLLLSGMFAAMAWFAPELSCSLSEGQVCK